MGLVMSSDYKHIRGIHDDAISFSKECFSRILFALKKQGFKNAELKRIGISSSYIAQLKSGHKLLNMKTINKISKEFELDIQMNINFVEKPRHTHDWNNVGEKCVKCGDPDWCASEFCSVPDKKLMEQ
jgi:hypothetical protein